MNFQFICRDYVHHIGDTLIHYLEKTYSSVSKHCPILFFRRRIILMMMYRAVDFSSGGQKIIRREQARTEARNLKGRERKWSS